MKYPFLALLTFAALCDTCHADDDLDALIGTWVSPDGMARQQLLRDFDGSWIQTRMWFREGEDWKLVAVGGMWRRPGETRWQAASRATGMEDIEVFEFSFESSGPATYTLVSVAYESDGGRMHTEEDWTVVSPDRVDYEIFRIEDGQRSPWMQGTWIREPRG
ncbi:MAG: hypothetical protein R3233_08750 [Xanthomonadales bacterium]|nr:hypothetical protein [Xanthomonadales bacterium]